ncbi:MAG: hypothetical protein C7B43_04270 [Sulfobacillus benefaciens]|uniref:Uncharacterized protein n=1 Tax=Sulfobacillus benefaciens TaxID=453960 RepID=A0A2T2X8U7_9FIRM|nr:MAG: hypothetical protein C7B43_04270 [Sulfobacillus benefaciens]
MRHRWLIGSFSLALLIPGGILGYHRFQTNSKPLMQISGRVLDTVLNFNAHTAPRQLTVLNRYVVSGSQADFFARWLAGQLTSQSQGSKTRLAATTIHIANESVFSQTATRAVIDYRLSVTHVFRPLSRVTTTEVVTLWLTRQKSPENFRERWKVYAIRFNFDPIDFPGLPPSESYDVWHLKPAPSLPHGV